MLKCAGKVKHKTQQTKNAQTGGEFQFNQVGGAAAIGQPEGVLAEYEMPKIEYNICFCTAFLAHSGIVSPMFANPQMPKEC